MNIKQHNAHRREAVVGTHAITALCPFGADSIEVIIEFRHSKGRPARRYLRNGDPGYPAEPEEVEFLSAKLYTNEKLPQTMQQDLDKWAELWLADDDGFERACMEATREEEA